MFLMHQIVYIFYLLFYSYDDPIFHLYKAVSMVDDSTVGFVGYIYFNIW